jgi:hypothetical protein
MLVRCNQRPDAKRLGWRRLFHRVSHRRGTGRMTRLGETSANRAAGGMHATKAFVRHERVIGMTDVLARLLAAPGFPHPPTPRSGLSA